MLYFQNGQILLKQTFFCELAHFSRKQNYQVNARRDQCHCLECSCQELSSHDLLPVPPSSFPVCIKTLPASTFYFGTALLDIDNKVFSSPQTFCLQWAPAPSTARFIAFEAMTDIARTLSILITSLSWDAQQRFLNQLPVTKGSQLGLDLSLPQGLEEISILK